MTDTPRTVTDANGIPWRYEGTYWTFPEPAGEEYRGVDAVAALCDALWDAQQANTRLREALDEIAAWNEGPTVTGIFDEPNAAAIARAALNAARAAGGSDDD